MRGLRLIATGGALCAAALLASAASAGVVLSDNFDASTPDVLNWAGDATFSSTTPASNLPNPASVDLIGAGGIYDFYPGHGSYVDLDGSSGNGNLPDAGQLTSVATFGPGSYTLTFDLGGNARGAPAQTTVVSLGAFSAPITLNSGDPYGLQTFNFFTATGGSLVFTDNGPSDQQGNILDNVTLTAVPEPATWAMMLIGIGALGGMLRGSRRKQAFATA